MGWVVLVLLHGRLGSFLSCSWILKLGLSSYPGEKPRWEGSRAQQPQAALVLADTPVHVTSGAVTPPGQQAGQNEALKSKNVIWSNIFKGKSRAHA